MYWVIDKKLAGSDIPSYSDLMRWRSEGIKAIVSLVEDHEFFYNVDIQTMRDLGFEVLWLPVKDMTAPPLDVIEKAVKWIDEKIKEGKKVVVHCFGGLGRSGTILAAYLIFKGKSANDAIKSVRRVRRGAIMTRDQELILYEFEKIMRNRNQNE